MTYTVETFDTRQAWLEARRTGIGGSDAGALWRASNWQSPYSVWWSKTQPPEKDDPTIEQEIGGYVEPYIGELFERATGIRVDRRGVLSLFRIRERPHVILSPDSFCLDDHGSAYLEFKTAKFEAAHVWKERIPPAYQFQLLHALAVTGLDRAYIAVLLNFSDFKWHVFDREGREDQIAAHLRKCDEFWENYVVQNTAPPTDYSQATADAIAARYPDARPDTIDLPETIADYGSRYDRCLARSKRIETYKSEIQNRVKDTLGEAAIGRLPDGSGFAWKGSNGKRKFARKKKVHDEQ